MRAYWISLIFLISLALGSCGKDQGMTPMKQKDPSSIEPQATSPESPVANSTHNPVKVMPLSTSLPDLPAQGDSTPMIDQPIPTDPNTQNLIAKAIEDLSERLSTPSDQIKIKKATETIWPDSSLGCPKIGVMYIQVVTPGFQIVLETSGKIYIYHTDNKDRFIFCPTLQSEGDILSSPYPDR